MMSFNLWVAAEYKKILEAEEPLHLATAPFSNNFRPSVLLKSLFLLVTCNTDYVHET